MEVHTKKIMLHFFANIHKREVVVGHLCMYIILYTVKWVILHTLKMPMKSAHFELQTNYYFSWLGFLANNSSFGRSRDNRTFSGFVVHLQVKLGGNLACHPKDFHVCLTTQTGRVSSTWVYSVLATSEIMTWDFKVRQCSK